MLFAKIDVLNSCTGYLHRNSSFYFKHSLFFSIQMQGYVDAVLDLASHFITRLRRYASFCRTLASHVGPSSTTGTSRNMVTSPTNSSPWPSNNQG